MTSHDSKICFAASSGGHYEELLMLKPLMEKYDSFVITEQMPYQSTVQGEKTYFLCHVNRKEAAFIPKMIVNVERTIKILVLVSNWVVKFASPF